MQERAFGGADILEPREDILRESKQLRMKTKLADRKKEEGEKKTVGGLTSRVALAKGTNNSSKEDISKTEHPPGTYPEAR